MIINFQYRKGKRIKELEEKEQGVRFFKVGRVTLDLDNRCILYFYFEIVINSKEVIQFFVGFDLLYLIRVCSQIKN